MRKVSLHCVIADANGSSRVQNGIDDVIYHRSVMM
jgi:hypothetical protein